MIRLLTILFFSLWQCASPAQPFTLNSVTQGRSLPSTNVAGGGGSFTPDFVETFDNATDYDHAAGWTVSGSANANFTPAIVGTESLAFTNGSIYRSVTNAAQTNYFFVFRWESWTNYCDVFEVRNVDSAGVGGVSSAGTSGTLSLRNGATYSDMTMAFNPGTNFMFWVTYVPGTGANGVAHCYVATNSYTKPASAQASITTGTSTNEPSVIFLRWRATAFYDRVITHSAVVPSDP
jgi:hypothetical protein